MEQVHGPPDRAEVRVDSAASFEQPLLDRSDPRSIEVQRRGALPQLGPRSGMDMEIVVMRADGADVRQLTAKDVADGWPDWSPEGRWIAFHSDRTGDCEIWVMRADGSDSRRLTPTSGTELAPVWIR